MAEPTVGPILRVVTAEEAMAVAARFEYSGAPDLNLREPDYPPGFLDTWHTHWAADVSGNLDFLQQKLHYYFVLKDELPGYAMQRSTQSIANDPLAPCVRQYGRSGGPAMYLMKCLKSEYVARKQAESAQSTQRMKYIRERKAPGVTGGLAQENAYTPELHGSDDYRPTRTTF
jgi:hypothetical protein